MGCGCKGGNNTQQTTQQTPQVNQTTANALDEQRVAQVKNEIRNIVNKYYTDGKTKK
jgi:hypothetical protein